MSRGSDSSRAPSRRAGSHGPEDEREFNPGVAQRAAQQRDDARRLHDNLAKWGVEWVAFRRAHIPAIAIPPVSQQAGAYQAIELQLNGPRSESGKAHQLSQIHFAIRRTKGLGEDGCAGAGSEYLKGVIG